MEDEDKHYGSVGAWSMANLARVTPEVWKELPKDIRDLIMKARKEEAVTDNRTPSKEKIHLR